MTQPEIRRQVRSPRPVALRVLVALTGLGAVVYAGLAVAAFVATRRAYAQAGPEDDTSLYGLGDLAAMAGGVLAVVLVLGGLLGWWLAARRHGAAAAVLGATLAVGALPLTMFVGLLG